MSDHSRRDFIRLTGAATAAAATASGLPLAAEARRHAVTDADVSKLYEAAKKEKTLTWWIAHYTQDTAERVRAAFMAKYPGIDVVFLRQTAQVVYQRLTQDLKANVHQVDVFASTDEAHYPVLKKQNALAEFVPGDLDKIPKAFRDLDPDNTYQLGTIALVLTIFNDKKVQAPKHWADLLDPKYKGQITTGHPGFSGYVGNWVVAMNDKYGWDYFKKLAANQPKIGRSIYDTVTDLVSGERNLGAGPDSLTLEKRAGGNPLNISYPEDGTVLITAPVAVMKEAPHPNAARLFMNFHYSKEYSQVITRTFNFPLREDVPSPSGVHLNKLKYYRSKVERLSVGIPEVVAKWRETFGV